MKYPIRVVLVDNHRLVRQGLRSVLDPDRRFEVVGEAASGADGLRLVAERQPDVVLLDLKLDDVSRIEVCGSIRQASPDTAVLILTAFLDRHLVDACLRAGARGYLLKDAENLRLAEQILTVVRGYPALAPRVAGVLVDGIYGGHAPLEELSGREVQVLRLIAQGLTNREIGRQLSLSEHTIKGHVKEILAKLGVRNRVAAVLRAKERGLI